MVIFNIIAKSGYKKKEYVEKFREFYFLLTQLFCQITKSNSREIAGAPNENIVQNHLT